MDCCQSCGMPVNAEYFIKGTEIDSSPNNDYCLYCYKDGKFTFDLTMEQMIDYCVTEMKNLILK